MTGEVDTIENEEALEQTEFEAAFNEEAEKRDTVPADDMPDDLPPDEPGEVDKPVAIDNTEKPIATDKEEQPFEGWPQEAIDRYNSQVTQTNKLQHQIDSDSGRVRAFQFKVTGLEDQIKTIQSGSKGDQPTNEEISDAMSGGDEDWASFSEDYPEVAAAIDKRFEKQETNLNTTLAPVIDKQAQDAVAAATEVAEHAYGEVAKTFPTWQTEVQKQEYRDWIANQSPGIKSLGDSDDTQDASTLIGLYDDYRVTHGKTTMRADPDTGVNDVTDEVTERRNRQLEDGVTLPSKTARVDDSQESNTEFENAFAAFAARKDAKRQ